MSTLQSLKTFINQRLAVAVDEIFGLLETTVSNYEQELQLQRRLREDEMSELLNIKADMQPAMRFRVINNHDIKKITFQNGIPSSVEDMIKVLKQAFSITTDVALHYKDADFDDFFTLTSTSDLGDKDTLKVVHLPPGILTATVPSDPQPYTSDVSSVDDPLSVDSQDNPVPLIATTERHNVWPAVFPIPTFSYKTEMALKQGHVKFLKDGTPLTSQSVKSDIMERLAEAMFSYTAYPNDPQRATVSQALIDKHPCLKEPGSFNGCYGWQQSLKYKCGNYRTKLKAHGKNPELLIYSLKHKQEGDRKPNKNSKKPRKSEVNYLPQHPAGETDDSLENVRLELIAANKAQDNGQMISDMTSGTYSFRRREVVGHSMHVAELKERWPALFNPEQTKEEFRRCNTIPLESTFLSELNTATGAGVERLTAVFSARVQQQLIMKEAALSEQQEWGSSLDQQDQEPPHIGEEKQHFWTSQEARGRLPCLHEEDVTKLPSTHVPVKSEDEETSQSSLLDQRRFEVNREAEPPVSSAARHVKTEPDEDDRQGPEPDRILVSGFKCLSESHDKTLCSSETQTVGRKVIRKPQTELNTVKRNVSVNDMDSNSDNKLFGCSKCGKRFGQKHYVQTHMRCHTGEKPFICSLCGNRFSVKGSLKNHMAVHTREKSCSCTVCGELFSHKGSLTQHMTVHTRETLDRTAFMTKDSASRLIKPGE